MAKINRSDVIQKAVNELAFSTSSDKIPTETLDKIQLTYDLNRKYSSFVIKAVSILTGANSIILPSISSGSETYITAITIGLIKDATCDIATGNVAVNIIPDSSNASSQILIIPVISLTAQFENISLSLPYPIKVKNGSTVSNAVTYSLGVMSRSISVIGFTTSSN